MDYLAEAQRVIDIELEAIRRLKNQLDQRFVQAVDWILETVQRRNKIIVLGVGKSGHIGRKIAATLTSTGTTSVVLDPVDALHGDLGLVNDGDLFLILSYSGESEEITNLLPILKRFDAHLIAITGNPQSPLAQHADLILPVRIRREACPFNLAPTASTTAMLVLGDALAIAVAKARGFQRQDFARNHPAGAIGRSLLLRARDIMRTGERLPLIAPDRSVREALLVMTRARAGCVIVVHPSGRLAGIFTDGDLRRHLAQDPNVLDRPIRQVMTKRPITIREDALAAEALRIFHRKNIDDLIVVNADRHPVGLIDSQDLPKLKLL